MILHRIKRKLYKALHPVVGEIWMLHRVVEQRSDKPEQRELEVTPDWLEGKILEYKKKGYSFVSIDDVSYRFRPQTPSRHPQGGMKKGKLICITFDDGYRDNHALAYPMLTRIGVPFTVYVTTGFVDNRLPMWWYPGQQLGISTDELLALDANPLCTIGAHTVSHPKLDTLPYDEQYKEIADSKMELERLLGHPVKHFSFPHGAYNNDTLATCRELGFQTVVQSWGGYIRHNERNCPLPRIEITQP